MRRIYKSRAAPVREVAWDIEATQWATVLCVTGVSSDGTCIRATSPAEYLERAREAGWLTPGTRHWAHFGGIYDHLLAMEFALHRWRLVRGCAGTSGLWLCDLRQGTHVWQLRDSSRLFQMPLAEVGETFGLPKDTSLDRSKLETYPIKLVQDYNERDCRVLLKAVLETREILDGMGIRLCDTLASSASNYARALLPADAFRWNGNQDAIAEKAYAGGRVERFRTTVENADEWDLNSCYAAALATPLPTRYVRCTDAPRDGEWYVAHARVSVPAGTRHPVLPLKVTDPANLLRDRLCFPSGEWDGCYTSDELGALQEGGGTVRKVYAAWVYEREAWLAPTIRKWWELRAQGPIPKVIGKLLMNSLAGKLIERAEYESLTQSTVIAQTAFGEGKKIRFYPMLLSDDSMVDLWSIASTKSGPLRHAAAAAYVTAHGRLALWRGMQALTTVAHVSTDSVIGVGTLPTGDGLGEWRHQGKVSRAELLAPGVYAVWRPGIPDPEITARGFRLPEGMNASGLWRRIANGECVEHESITGFRSMMARGRVEVDVVRSARRHQPHLDKRDFVTPDISRAWDVEELRARRDELCEDASD